MPTGSEQVDKPKGVSAKIRLPIIRVSSLFKTCTYTGALKRRTNATIRLAKSYVGWDKIASYVADAKEP